MVLVFNAVVLHHRAGDHARPSPRAIAPSVRRLTGLLTGLAVVVLATGTLVTGTGPHTGSREDPIVRLPFTVREVARVHGTTVVITLIVVAALILAVRRHVPSGDPLQQAVRWLVAVVVAQAAIGWTQYFTGVPVVLVGLHVAGATTLWIVVVKLRLLATDASSATSNESDAGK